MCFISICILAASSRYPTDWRFWVFLAALFAFYYWFSSWSAKRRRRALAQLAPTMGFLSLETMPETPGGIAFLRTGLGGEFSNAMTGSGAGCEVTLFDFEYEARISGRMDRMHRQTIAAFRSAHSILPAFQFGPEPAMRKMFTVGAEEQFKFETPLSSVCAPVGHYLLRSKEQSAAEALFDSGALKFFDDLGLQHQPWLLEGNQEWLLVWEHNNVVPPQNYPWFLQQTSAIAAMVFGCSKMRRAAITQMTEEALAFAPYGATVGQSIGGGAAAASATATTDLTESLAGALAYVSFLPAIFFLLFKPYNKNRFVRFHSFQCIFLNVAWFVLWFALSLLGSAPDWASPLILPLGLAGFGLWLVLILQAHRGRIFKLPVIGDLAEKQANNA